MKLKDNPKFGGGDGVTDVVDGIGVLSFKGDVRIPVQLEPSDPMRYVVFLVAEGEDGKQFYTSYDSKDGKITAEERQYLRDEIAKYYAATASVGA